MPALECKYSVADDDFVPSSIVSTAIRFCLFCWILCANAYILVTLDSSADCPDGVNCCSPQPSWVLTAYLFGELFLEFLVMTVSFLIFLVSASGTLRERFSDVRLIEQERNEESGNGANPMAVNQSRLSSLRVLVCARAVLFFPELCFSAMGLVVAFHPQLLNQPPCASNNIFQLLAAYSVVTTVVSTLKIIYYLAALDPAGWCSPGPIDYIKEVGGASYRRTHGKGGRRRKIRQTLHRNRTTQLWQKRINMLACGSVNGSQNVNSSILEAARLFSVVFHDQFPNYTLSDIATAIVLLSNEQKECCSKHSSQECFKLKILREKLYQQMKENEFCDGEQDKHMHHPPVPVNLDDPAEFTDIDDAVYFFRYAMAVYGWPLYVFANPLTGCCKLGFKSLGICCTTGKCCHCSEAAFKLEAGMGFTDENIAHHSMKNEVFCSPYKVVLDTTRKAIVVAIRGTLSVEDAVTSLSISLTPLFVDEPPYDTLDTQVHKGYKETAEKILKELTESPNFSQLLTDPKYSDYRLVVVGHSLGGAVAAVLSVLIKQEYKEHAHRLKSFGYSTPGCVFTYPLAKYCRDFVTTVILDNDLLPRLTWRSMLLLRATLKEALETCNRPKHQVLYTDPIMAACKKASCRSGSRQEYVVEEETGDSNNGKYRGFVNSVYDNPDWKKCLGPFFGEHMSFESAVKAITMIQRWQRKANIPARPTKQIFEPNNPRAFLPGRVLQIDTETERLHPSLPWPKRTCCQLKWVANEDYCQMLLHKGPLSSHLPNNVFNALNIVKQQYLQQKGLKPDLTFGQGMKDDNLHQQEEAAASGADLDGNGTREVTVEVAEHTV